MPRIDQIDRPTDSLLLLFSYSPTIRGVTRVQKLLFLLNHETKYGDVQKDSVLFEFEPYKMGPFAAEIYEELDFLLEIGAIESKTPDSSSVSDEWSEGEVFVLTNKGKKISRQLRDILPKEVDSDLHQFVQRYSNMELKQLLRYVYDQYPDMARESEIRDSIY